MSIHLTIKVWDESPNRNSILLVELALADSANDDGTCCPVIRAIAAKSRVSTRQVHRVIATLINQGRLQVTKRDGLSSVYTLTIEAEDKLSESKGTNLTGGDTLSNDKTNQLGVRQNRQSPLLTSRSASANCAPPHPRKQSAGEAWLPESSKEGPTDETKWS